LILEERESEETRFFIRGSRWVSSEPFISHDLRQLEAARRAGLPTVSPGMKR
jgi:hypothetical protein